MGMKIGGFMSDRNRSAAWVAFALAAMILSACADSASTPVAVAALPPEQRSSLKISEITDEAAPGVVVPSYDLERLLQRIKEYVSASHPEILREFMPESDAPAAKATKVKIVITQYDEGNRIARAMLAGLGQAYLDGDVVFIDVTSGQEVARYKVSKDFAFGGLYGAVTGMEDVEKGFAKSVAQILTDKQ